MGGRLTKEEATILPGPTIIADGDHNPLFCQACNLGKGDELMGVVITEG